MILPASFLHCYNDNIFKGEKNRQFLDNFLTKSAIVFLLELAETCSTLKMEMSRSWFDENSKREAWFLRAKLALFFVNQFASPHCTRGRSCTALHFLYNWSALDWGAQWGQNFFEVFINDFAIFLGKYTKHGINLALFLSTRSLHLTAQRSIQHCTAFPLKLICIGLGRTMGPKHFWSFH